MNISKKTIKRLEDEGYRVWADIPNYFLKNDKDFKNGSILCIAKFTDGGGLLSKRLVAPKTKEITISWVMNKLNNESAYVDIAKYLSRIIKGSGIYLYAASYGIGIDALFGVNKNTEKKVTDILNNLGLKFRTEYSEANWVYRFIVSKCKSNMDIIKSIN